MTGINEGSVCVLKGDGARLWRVVYIGVNLGGHYQEAHLLPAGESWGKPLRQVPLADLMPAPLEPLPCRA